jgi:hypothetical protein
MNVQVRHSLPSGRPIIDANVVTLGFKLIVNRQSSIVNRQFGKIKQLQDVTSFLNRQVKKRGSMPFRNQQGVTR